MWAIAGVLLGLVLLSSIVGFHTGPHGHIAAGVLGGVTAVWLLVMALTGQTAPLLWALLSADVVLTAGIGTAAYKGLKAEHQLGPARSLSLGGSSGVALSVLDPDGLVRVAGETWSATSLNGTIAKGAEIQVVEHTGVRLEVWGVENPPLDPARPIDGAVFELDTHNGELATPDSATAAPDE